MAFVLRVFVPFALGYFLSYLFRVVNAVIAPDLVSELGLSAADLGLLTSTYFLTFASFQLPLGLLLDRFGPRRTEAALLIFAAVGAIVFATATSLSGLVVGRALIGFGVSACLMASFKAYVQWFPTERLPLVNGCQMAAGGLGALTATIPVEAALHFTDWRGVFVILGVVTAVAAVILFLVVPRHETDSTPAPLREQLAGVAEVMTSPLFWRIAPITVATFAAFSSFQGLWAGPWLRDVVGLDRGGVATHLSVMAVSMTLGFVLIGAIADRLGRIRIRIRPMAVAVAGMVLTMVFLAVVTFDLPLPVMPVLVLLSFFSASGPIVYAGLSQVFPRHLTGRVNTSLNLLAFVANFLLQWGIGMIIDLWPTTAIGGYDPAAYKAGLGLALGLQAAALVWLILFRRVRLPLRG